MLGICQSTTVATFTTIGNALQSVRSAKELVIGRKTGDLGFQVQDYEVELADGKVVSTNTVLRGCTLALLLRKIVCIPLPNGEILEVQGERPKKDPGSLACIKADEKKLDDIRVVQDLLEIFPDDLSGLPHVREIEFRIDLISSVLPVVKSPYRLAPSEMSELSNQLKKL
nr:hypothetical protein [Tanacetum cinerariifolium]